MEWNRVHGRSSPIYTCLVNTKNVLTSLATWEVQIKTTLGFHLTPAMVAPSRAQITAHSGVDVETGNA